MYLEQLLSVEQLAELLHKSPASIRSDASRKPSSLPPICRLPGNKRLLWRQHDVDAWLARFASLGVQQAAAQAASVVSAAKRRGRPTKKEQITRKQLHTVSTSMYAPLRPHCEAAALTHQERSGVCPQRSEDSRRSASRRVSPSSNTGMSK